MKKALFILLFLSMTGLWVCAQQKQSAINFQQKLKWKEIKQKAKQENKFIFLDFNTSWCIPCRRMETEIFTKDKVAEYVNQNFISSSYRCDTTANDTAEIRDRYPDALTLLKELNIKGYPTYVILNPDGNMVHKVVGYIKADVFIDELKMGLDPKTQYLTLVEEFNKGNRSENFLLKLVNTSERVNDYVKLPEYINSYLKTQKKILTPKNIEFIARATKKRDDVGFRVLTNYPEQVDQVIGANRSAEIVSRILFNELAIGFVRINGKTEYKPAAMMVVYSGEIQKKVNWAGLKKKLDHNYPRFSSAVMNYSRISYYSWVKDWANLAKVITDQLHKRKFTYRFIENSAQTIIEGCDDKIILNEALRWYNSKYLPEDPYSFWTKSDLLFKLGRINDAISELDLNRSKDDPHKNEQIESAIKKMRDGKNRWSS